MVSIVIFNAKSKMIADCLISLCHVIVINLTEYSRWFLR